MKLFHKDKWVEKERFYATSKDPALSGMTTIHFVCDDKHWFKQIPGKQVRNRRRKEK